jgi:two-component system OmpR family sensor kinase
MNRHALSTRISVIFGITFALACLLFLLLGSIQTNRSLENMQERQFQAINYLFQLYQNNTPPRDLEAFFRHFGFRQVENRNLMVSVLEGGEVVFHRQSALGALSSIVYNSRYYLLIDSSSLRVLLENQGGKQASDFLWIGFALALILLASMYVSVIKSLNPLRSLSQTIRRFAGGDMEISCKSDEKDEIAEVANEFDRAVKKIRDLIRSRQLFLRTIMHELKTPIGKGRIVAEMVDNPTQKARLVGVFERLDLLLNEFSKIEQLVSKSYALNKQEHPLSLILEHASDLLMLDSRQLEERLRVEIKDDPLVYADFDLLSLAFKNLLDNGLKYASNKSVHVKISKDYFCVFNEGPPLNHPIDYYLEAFVTTGSPDGKGMGLGLYIIKNILELHGYLLEYEYKDGLHHFYVFLSTHCDIDLGEKDN